MLTYVPLLFLYFEPTASQSTTMFAALPQVTPSDFIGYTPNGSGWNANYCPMSR